MRIIRNNIIPFRGFAAINLFGVLFVRKGSAVTPRLLNHEAIHTAQMREWLYVMFYMLYVLEWLVRLVQYRNCKEAYRNISFEREAYACQYDMKYLRTRKHYATLKYIKENGKDKL